MGATADGPSPPASHPASPHPLRRATPADAEAVAELHVAGIREGFLSSLGPRFLTHLYARIARRGDCFLVVATDATGDRVVGFIAGAEEVGRLYRTFIVRDGLRASLSAVPALLRSLPRVVETLRHGRGGGDAGRGTELLAVAVATPQRGHGLGRVLVEAFLEEATARGAATAHVVVGAANETAIRLYRQAGFTERARFELHAGVVSLLLEWDGIVPRASR